MVRYPAKANSLRFLREAGVPVETVLDAGAHVDTPELRAAFPDKRQILFEPASNFHDALRRNYANLDYVLAPIALSDLDGEGSLRKTAIEGGETTHATLVDPSDGGPSEIVAVSRLDTFMSGRDDPKPYLLKIDVDGYEIPILRGAERIWDDISVLIVEATLETFVERMNYITSRGFRLFDIVDQCYYHGMFSQADLVFVAERYMVNAALRPWQTRDFSWDAWIPIASFEAVVQDATASVRHLRAEAAAESAQRLE